MEHLGNLFLDSWCSRACRCGCSDLKVGSAIRLRPLLLAVFPSVIAALAWFTVSPPSYRFIWEPLFLTLIISIAFVLHSIGASWVKPVLIVGLATVLGSVTLFTAIARVDYGGMSTEGTWSIGPISVPYSYASSLLPEAQELVTGSGLVLRTPVASGGCWAVFPLYTVSQFKTVSLSQLISRSELTRFKETTATTLIVKSE